MGLSKNKIKDLLLQGRTVKGSFICTREPACVEILGYAGFDFVLIDTEHAPNTATEVINLVRAAEAADIEPVVRVRANDPTLILQALDVGAKGILVPRVNTAVEAQAVVQAAKYGPAGERGLAGIVRAAKYGFTPGGEYVTDANSNIFIMVQVEELEAVDNLDDILSVEGIDAIFIGPVDLSQSMGLTGQFNHPDFQRTVENIISRATTAGKPVAMFCLDGKNGKQREKAGVSILTVASDTMLLAAAAKQLKQDLEQ